MNPSAPFIRRPAATTLIMLGILLAGLVGFLLLPVSALPQVEYPTIQVMTFYPGASPDVMASAITAPLERQFGQVPGLAQMTSTSSDGASVIVLQFILTLNIDVAEQEVQAAINAAQTYLPSDLPAPPVYSKSNPAEAPILTLALTSKTMPLSEIEDLADTRLAQKIAQVPGVGLVTISGGQKPAVRIQANPTALSSYGLDLEDVRTALAATSLNAAKGSFDGPEQAYQIDANDQLLSADDYKKVVVAYRNGAPVRLADVATIIPGVENARQAAWMNQVPAVIVNVQRQPGANTIKVVNSIEAVLGKLGATMPPAVAVTTVTDRTTTIRASVADVELELLLTVALVVLVIFLFLRSFAATFIPSVAVPLSLFGTFGVMYLWGFSLNNLTLMALTIATGFVVDDAIVMIENIARFVEEGEKPLDAALKGAKQIGFTIVSLTVSLIAVLIPLLLMGSLVGRLFREFAITLSVMILISAIVSLTLTPMLSARLLRRVPESGRSRLHQVSEAVWKKIISAYDRSLVLVLQHQTAVLLVALATLGFTVYLYVIVPKGFFPVQDTGLIQGITEATPTISFPAMAKKQQQLAAVLLKDPAVASLSSFIGVDGTNKTLNSGRIMINLKPYSERHMTARDLIPRLSQAAARFAGIQLYLQPVQELTVETQVSRTQYQYTLSAPDTAELGDWTTRLLGRLGKLPALADVATDLQDTGKAARLVVDRVTASRLGIAPSVIDNALYDAFGQRQVSTLYTQTNQYHVILEALPGFQQGPQDLRHIYVRSMTTDASGNTVPGGPVPLDQVSRIEETAAPLAINHLGQFPSATVSFNVSPGVSLGEATTAIDRAAADLHMPQRIQRSFQGSAAAFRESLKNEPILILAALITVYIVLGVLYESFIHPVTILSTLPSAGVGALLALILTGEQFDMVSLIGIILLIGIVKKNGIMMVDFAIEAEREQHLSPRQAIYQACLLRFRPIMMTTMAALFAGLPLALGPGIGAELRRPLGIAMVGGLLVSQALTLYTTPVIYLFFNRLARKAAGRFPTAHAPAETPP